MSDRGLEVCAVVLGLVLVAVVAVGSVLGSRSIAGDLTTRVELALTAAGLDDVAVDVRGREVDLRPATERDLVRATRVVEGVEGVRWARLDPSIGSADLRPSVAFLELEQTGVDLEIGGAVPDAASAAALKAGASAAFGLTVRGDVVVDPSLPRADWTDDLPGVLGDLAPVKDVAISIDDGDVLRVSGRIESIPGRDRVIALATSALPDVTVSADLDVDPGSLTTADASVLNSLEIVYSRGAVDLGATDLAAVDRVADVLLRAPAVEVEVVGHAGPDDEPSGRAAARARVAAVQDRLVEQGVPASRLSGTTFVSSHRADDDVTSRRVDLVVTGA